MVDKKDFTEYELNIEGRLDQSLYRGADQAVAAINKITNAATLLENQLERTLNITGPQALKKWQASLRSVAMGSPEAAATNAEMRALKAEAKTGPLGNLRERMKIQQQIDDDAIFAMRQFRSEFMKKRSITSQQLVRESEEFRQQFDKDLKEYLKQRYASISRFPTAYNPQAYNPSIDTVMSTRTTPGRSVNIPQQFRVAPDGRNVLKDYPSLSGKTFTTRVTDPLNSSQKVKILEGFATEAGLVVQSHDLPEHMRGKGYKQEAFMDMFRQAGSRGIPVISNNIDDEKYLQLARQIGAKLEVNPNINELGNNQISGQKEATARVSNLDKINWDAYRQQAVMLNSEVESMFSRVNGDLTDLQNKELEAAKKLEQQRQNHIEKTRKQFETREKQRKASDSRMLNQVKTVSRQLMKEELNAYKATGNVEAAYQRRRATLLKKAQILAFQGLDPAENKRLNNLLMNSGGVEAFAGQQLDQTFKRQQQRDQNRNSLLEYYKSDPERRRKHAEHSIQSTRDRFNAYGGGGIFGVQAQLMGNYALMAGGLGSMFFLGQYAVEFEKSLAQLQAIASATEGDLSSLENTIVSLATSSNLSAVEITEAATLMAQAGLSAQQIAESLPAITRLAVGTGTDLETTVDVVTSTMTVFKLQTAEAAEVANTLTAAMNLSKLSVDKYALGVQYAGNIAATQGVTYNELAAAMGGMANAGIKAGSTLGTGLRQFLIDLQSPTEKAAAVFDRLGLSTVDLDVKSQGLFGVLRNLRDAGFTSADAFEAFEVRAVAAFKAMSNNLPMIEELNTDILNTSAAVKASETQLDTVAAAWTRFGSAAGNMAYKNSEALRKSLKFLFDGLVQIFKILSDLSPVLQQFGVLMAGSFAAYSIGSIAKMVRGLMEMNSEFTILNKNSKTFMGSMNKLSAASLGLGVAFTAVSVGASIIDYYYKSHAEKLELLEDRVSTATAETNKYKESIKSVDNSIERLIYRYDSLSGPHSDLDTEIISLTNRYADMGLQLDSNADSIDNVISKMINLREEAVKSQRVMEATKISNQQALLEEKNKTTLRSLVDRPVYNGPTGGFYSGTTPSERDKFNHAFPVVSRLESSTQDSLFNIFNKTRFGTLSDLPDSANLNAILNKAVAELGVIGRDEATKGLDTLSEFNSLKQELLSFFDPLRAAVAERDKLESEIFQSTSNERTLGIASQDNVLEFRRLATDLQTRVRSKYNDIQDTVSDVGTRLEATKNLKEVFGSDVNNVLTKWDNIVSQLAQSGMYDSIKNTSGTSDEEFRRTLAAKELMDSANTQDISKLYMFAKNFLDRGILTESSDGTKELKKQSQLESSNHMKQMRFLVKELEQAKKHPEMKYEGFLNYNDRLRSVRSLGDAYIRAEENTYAMEYPNYDRRDSQGKLTNPNQYLGFQRKRNTAQITVKEIINDLIETQYNDTNKSLSRNNRFKALKKQGDRQHSDLRTLISSVNSNSAPSEITNILEQYETMFGEYMSTRLAQAKQEWKANGSEGNLQEYLSDVRDELDNEMKRDLSKLSNMERNTRLKLTEKMYKAKRESLENDIKNTISSDKSFEEMVNQGAEIFTAATETFKKELESSPANASRLEVKEVAEQISEQLGQYGKKWVDYLQEALDQSLENLKRQAYAEADMTKNVIAMMGNTRNKGRFGELDFKYANIMLEQDMIEGNSRYVEGLEMQKQVLQNQSEDPLISLQQREAVLKQIEQMEIRINDAKQEGVRLNGELADPTDGMSFTDQLTDKLKKVRTVLEDEIGEIPTMSQAAAEGVYTVFSELNAGLSSTLSDVILGTKSIEDAFGDLAKGILKALLDMATKILANQIIIWALSLLPGGQSIAAAMQTAGPMGMNIAPVKKSNTGGLVKGLSIGRDNQPHLLEPNEFVMRKSAVDMIGADNLAQMNASGRLITNNVPVMPRTEKREPDTVNLWVVDKDQVPPPGPKDIVHHIGEDIKRGGQTKRLIKAVQVGAM